MPIGAQMQSTSYSNLLVTDRLTIGTLSIRVHKMQVQLLEKNVFTLGRDARTRHTALFETSPHETWKVPRGETIIGVTIVPRNEATLNILKALPTSLQSTEQVTTPCGEVAFALYKTADASTLTSCNPAGTPYTPADNAFTSFWSNFSHTNNSASGNIATGGRAKGLGGCITSALCELNDGRNIFALHGRTSFRWDPRNWNGIHFSVWLFSDHRKFSRKAPNDVYFSEYGRLRRHASSAPSVPSHSPGHVETELESIVEEATSSQAQPEPPSAPTPAALTEMLAEVEEKRCALLSELENQGYSKAPQKTSVHDPMDSLTPFESSVPVKPLPLQHIKPVEPIECVKPVQCVKHAEAVEHGRGKGS